MKLIFRMFGFILLFISPLFAQVSGLSGWNIFIDPGHSGTENMGIYNYSEAERNLRVGLRLREMFLETTDIDTAYICRTNDYQQVDLSQRTDMANSLGAAWYHSIHSDASANPGTNSTLLLWGQYYNGAEKVPNGGKAMSDIMIDLLSRGMRIPSTGSKGDCSFYSSFTTPCSPTFWGPWLHVNRETTMPSELSESGFHTNPRQNQLFMNADWKKLEAKTFYWSVLNFHELERPFAGIATGIISDYDSYVPVNGAIVTIGDKSDTTDTYESLFYRFTSNPDLLHNGFFFIDNLENENYQMIVAAEDYYSDTLEVSPSDSFFTFQNVQLISKKSPYVLETNPAQGDSNVVPWVTMTITFSRQMDYTSVTENLIMTPDAEKSFYWSGNGTRLIIMADTLEYKTTYSITVPGTANDTYGHLFDGNGDGVGGDDFTLTFKTGTEDRTPPSVAEFYPLYNLKGIDTSPIISFTFDELINPSTITDEMFNLTRNTTGEVVPVVFAHYEINEQSVINYFPNEELLNAEWYIGKLEAGYQDISGNMSARSKSLSFETTGRVFNTTTIDDFESNVTSNWWSPGNSGSTTGIVPDSTSRSVSNDYVNLVTGSNSSLKIKYGWETGAGSWLIRVYLNESTPKNVHFDKDYVMQAYIFGDGSGNKFRFAVDDKVPNYAAANHEVSPWYSIDWIGWRLVSWDMTNDSTGTWLGDGNLDGTLRFDSIQLTYEPGSPAFGEFYIDDLQVLLQTNTNVDILPEPQIVGDFRLEQNYPNPFNSSTIIPYQLTKQAENAKISIFNSLGQIVANFENLSTSPGYHRITLDWKNVKSTELTTGTYYYELNVDGKKETRKMIYLR